MQDIIINRSWSNALYYITVNNHVNIRVCILYNDRVKHFSFNKCSAVVNSKNEENTNKEHLHL